MFSYYLDLAVRSLRRNPVLTGLMVLTLAVGIGACITTLTVLKLLSGDPIPGRSARLFYPQMDPRSKDHYTPGQSKPAMLLSYTDAMSLLQSHRAKRQTAVALTQAKITRPGMHRHPFFSDGVMTTADFFPMFDVPFRYGSGWSAADDADRARVVVIAGFLNDKLFGGANSVGRNIRIGSHVFRIVGVLRHWSPQPQFYALGLGGRNYGASQGVFLPLKAARADRMFPQDLNCYQATTNIRDLENAPCIWLGVWAELDDAAAVSRYRTFLHGYVQQQIALGRFQRPTTALSDMMRFLRTMQVVPDDVRLQAGLAFGFLLICVVNTVGLLLAKCLRRSREVGVRRALGAMRRDIFVQLLIEASVVGLAGGALGLLLAELGLWGVRHQPADYAKLAHLDIGMFVFTFVVALVASLIAGLLPAWRACVISPAPQLKSA